MTAQEVFKAYLDAATQHVRAHTRKGRAVRAYTREVVYVKQSDLELKKGWGAERWWQHRKTLEVMKGEVATKFELPLLLWHVSTNVNAVLQSGRLKWMGGKDVGGLGGGGSMTHRGVSFTASREDAILIQRELLRAAQIARGGRPLEVMLKDFAFEDSRFYHKDLSDAAVKALGTYHKDKDTPGWRFDTFRSYLFYRQQLGGPEDPIIFGRPEVFKRLYPSNVGIFAVRREDIPNEALIMKSPIGQNALHEIRVFAEVPVHGSLAIRRSRYRHHPMRLTAHHSYNARARGGWGDGSGTGH